MQVLLFGIAREIVGKNRLAVESAEQVRSVGELKDWMVARYPDLGKLSSMAVAVDSEYADDTLLLTAQNEIALIPPVSGG